MGTRKRQLGFTIVELLIVVVVIAILASITIVTYSGIQKQAITAVVKSDLQSVASAMQIAIIDQGGSTTAFPATAKVSPGVVLALTDTGDVNTFCLNGSHERYADITYRYDSDEGSVRDGSCSGTEVATLTGEGSGTPTVTIPGTITALQSAYNFNEGSGTTANDISGYGHNLTRTSGVSGWNSNGHTGMGANLVPTGSDVSTFSGTVGSLIDTTWTFMAWVKVDTALSANEWYEMLVNQTSDKWFEIGGSTGGTRQINYYAGEGNVIVSGSGNEVPLGQWAHVAVTTAGPEVKIYINGQQVATTGSFMGGAVNFNSTFQLGFSGYGGSATLDDLRIFSDPLTAAQINEWKDIPVSTSVDGTANTQ